MARIDIKAGATILANGLLQLENGAAMDTTLRSVTDQNNTASQLKLASNATQVVGTLQITTNNNPYIDAEDGAGNNRFTIGRAPTSQQVNVDFASNPTSDTDAVGAFRTYANGVALSEAMTFLRNGNVGVGTTAPTDKFHVYNTAVADLYLKIQTTQSRTSGVISQNSTANWFAGTQYSATNAYQVFDQTNNRLQLTMFNTGNSQFSISNTAMGAKLGIQGSGSTSATTSFLVQNSGGSEKFRIYDGLNSDIVMSSNPKNNGDGIIIQALSGTTMSPSLTFKPLTGSGQGRVYSDANRLYLGMTNTSGVASNNAYLFTIDNRLSKFAVTPDGSTTDASFYGKAIWDGGAAMTLRASSATQTANIFNVDNFDSTSSFVNVSAAGNLRVGNGAVDTARLSIKGSGSTSATTSLLVQNSAGTELFRVRDDGNFNLAQGGLYWNTIGFGSYITSDGYTMFYNTRQDTKEHRFTIGGTEVFRVNRMSATDTRVVINNTSNGYASAVLSADSTTQGFLPPRMTNAQRLAIVTPAVGLMVYCTDAVEGLYVYKSIGWTFVI